MLFETNPENETKIGDQLATETLARIVDLPTKPTAITLDGEIVRLEPIDLQRDNATLFSLSNGDPIVATGDGKAVPAYDPDQLIWKYMSAGPFPTSCKLAAFLFAQVQADNGLCFCVFDKASNRQVGVVNYMNNFPAHLKIELGNIWYSPVVQGTNANLEATYLLLDHAFSLGYRRIEWKCDALNERSRKAALRMGFKFEGIQESHFIVKGRNRDTAWYRMLEHEWPEAKMLLQSLMLRK